MDPEPVIDNGGRAAEHHGKFRMRRPPVGPQHDIRVEDGDERGQVAVARRGEEGIDHFALAADIGIRGVNLGSSDPGAGPGWRAAWPWPGGAQP